MGSKKYRGWESGLRLDEARVVAAETPKQHRSKKDRRHWCRGKVGIEHKPEYRISKNNQYWLTRYPGDYRWSGGCGWRQDRRWVRAISNWEYIPDKWYYSCLHEKGCSECGKILTYSHRLLKIECPEWKPR